jgi:hypothetical protein
MARFAKLNCVAYGASFPQGAIYELGILGQTVRFHSAPASYGGVLDWYFGQQHAGEGAMVNAEANAASFVNSVKAYLNSIGETRYDVFGVVTYDTISGSPASLAVSIKAKEYNDALNFTSAQVLNSGSSTTSAKVQYTNDYPPTAEAIVANAICFGSSTGSIALNVAGGYAPYTFEWSDGSTEKDRFDLAHGEYEVIVTDSQTPQQIYENGWTYPGWVTEDHPGVVTLKVIVGQNNQLLVVGNVGNDSIAVDVTGGVFPYTYEWSDGIKTRNRTNVEPGKYTLTVRDAGGCSRTVNFTISLERFFFSRNPVLLELQAADIEAKPNLRFICEVWVEPEYLSGNFVLATPDAFEHPADAEGKTKFDVSEILNAFVEPHLPDFNQKVVKRADKAFKRFYLRYTEAYGDPVVPESFIVQDNRYVLCGGLDAAEHFANTFFKSYLPNRKPFFSWDPAVKSVLVNQPEHLYFMPDSFELLDFRVKAKVTFTDGSITTFQPFLQAGIRRFELYSIPVGHDQLGLGQLQPGKQVRSWDIYLVDSLNNVISETRRYILDGRHYEQVHFFVYANALGGYNTLAATGRSKLSVDPQAQLIERERPADALSGDTLTLSKYSKRTLQLTSGHKSRAELEALQDFLTSEDVKLVGIDRFIPGRLSDRSADVYDSTKPLNGISFDFILPKMYSYTPSLKLAGYADESNLLTPLKP